MKKKIVIILFCISMICNILFIINKLNKEPIEDNNTKIQSNKGIIENEVDRDNTISNYETLNLDINPIDNLFKDNISGTTIDMRRYTNLYRKLWEDEMNHAYEKLMEKGHINIKDYIIESRNSYIQYTQNRVEVVTSIYASSAFDDEYKDDKNIHYGTSSLVIRNIELAKAYKLRTMEIFEYFNNIGIKIEYVFNKKNLSEEGLEIINLF